MNFLLKAVVLKIFSGFLCRWLAWWEPLTCSSFFPGCGWAPLFAVILDKGLGDSISSLPVQPNTHRNTTATIFYYQLQQEAAPCYFWLPCCNSLSPFRANFPLKLCPLATVSSSTPHPLTFWQTKATRLFVPGHIHGAARAALGPGVSASDTRSPEARSPLWAQIFFSCCGSSQSLLSRLLARTRLYFLSFMSFCP